MDRMKAILTLSAAFMFVASPLFSGAFRGFAPEQFPIPQLDPPIVPAGYAFAIWGLIYAYLVLHAGFGLLKRDIDGTWDRVRWPLIVSLTVGASWISVAKISPLWATVLIWVMLLTALGALFRSSGSQRPMAPASATGDLCRLADSSKLCVHWPGWSGLWCIH